MGKQRVRRLLARARAAEAELAELRADRPIVDMARLYVGEIEAPNLKRPGSINIARDWLVRVVRERYPNPSAKPRRRAA